MNKTHSIFKRFQSSLTNEQRVKLAAILRVDHAGEVAADAIYRGQHLVLNQRDPQDMWEQEKKHLVSFDSILSKNRVRPSLLRPVWEGLGFALGVSTALLGKEAAMACTEAVETVIGNHYNEQVFLDSIHGSQLRELLQISNDVSIKELEQVIKEFRDDELEHLKIAVENDAKKASSYPLLNSIIQGGCKVAIQVAKRI